MIQIKSLSNVFEGDCLYLYVLHTSFTSHPMFFFKHHQTLGPDSLKLSTKSQGLVSKLLTWLGDVWKTKSEGCVIKNNRNSIILIKIYRTGLMWKNIVTYRSWQHITVSTKDTFIIKIPWFVMLWLHSNPALQHYWKSNTLYSS